MYANDLCKRWKPCAHYLCFNLSHFVANALPTGTGRDPRPVQKAQIPKVSHKTPMFVQEYSAGGWISIRGPFLDGKAARNERDCDLVHIQDSVPRYCMF